MGEKKGKWGEEKEKVGRGGGGGRCRHWGNSERKKGSSLGSHGRRWKKRRKIKYCLERRVPRISGSVMVIKGVWELLLYTPLPSWTTETEMTVAPALLNFL